MPSLYCTRCGIAEGFTARGGFLRCKACGSALKTHATEGVVFAVDKEWNPVLKDYSKVRAWLLSEGFKDTTLSTSVYREFRAGPGRELWVRIGSKEAYVNAGRKHLGAFSSLQALKKLLKGHLPLKESVGVDEVSPPSWSGTVKALKKRHPEIDNPWALCLVGETEIPLLSGGVVSVGDLAASGEKVWLYGIDVEQFLVVPAIGWAQYVGSRRVVEIEIDSGSVIRCSPEHRWVLRDGSFREAGKLVSGDSLMPFRRRCARRSGRAHQQHEMVYHPGLARDALTHWSVMRCVGGPCPGGDYVIHHVNGDQIDNRPDNLEWMTNRDHQRHHFGERVDKMRAGSKRWFSDPENKRAFSACSRRVMKANWENQHFRVKMTQSNRERAKAAAAIAAEVNRKATPDVCDRIVDIYQSQGLYIREISERVGLSRSTVGCVLRDAGFTRGRGRGERSVAGNNHKVKEVRTTDLVLPMYDVAVEGVHTFAIVQGVFSHNSWSMYKKGYKSHEKPKKGEKRVKYKTYKKLRKQGKSFKDIVFDKKKRKQASEATHSRWEIYEAAFDIVGTSADRYTALGIPYPDPDTMCGGECEGVGTYPVRRDEATPEELEAVVPQKREDGTFYEKGDPDDDGWIFVRCAACNGTGRKDKRKE